MRIYLMIALVIGSIAFGWQIRDWQADSDALEAKNQVIATVKTELIAQGKLALEDSVRASTLEETIAAIRPTIETVTLRETQYEKEPIYISCTVPLDGVRYYNQRVAQRKSPEANATGKRIGTVSVSPAIAQ